ncbi:MAG: ATP-binding protein [Hydrococcus sp. Prado102]|nr:ATP-binding protein [Hydrococcus sp. Prado102]
MTQEAKATLPEDIFAGGGEMGALMRSLDWSKTPLGAIETWPQSLRSSLSICLNSRFPIAIYWGQEAILLYNDAWRPIVGNKHPWSLGRPGREVWSEIWDDIGPELAGVLATGEGTFHKDELLSMYRFGYTEECFFEYTFNPIKGEGGIVDGVINIVSETTYRVLNDRRARLLRELASKTGIAKTAEEACALMLEAFESDPLDIPLALLYLVDPDGKKACLCKGTKSVSDSSVSPAAIDLTSTDNSNWPIALAVRSAHPQEVTDLVSRFGALPGSPWAEPPVEAMVLPLAAAGQGKVSGVLVAVASPRRRLDDRCRDFFNRVAGQVAVAIANAQAYEEERKRAEALAELDRAKTIFFSNVSHEFRTPLTLILNPLEELSNSLDGRLQPDEREQFQLLQRNGLRLQKLVNTLLDFSRIEAGRIQASYEPTDLASFTAELASVFRSTIERARLTLEIECEPLSEPVYVDREMWEKIVFNLMSNAFKFTFEGKISVRLRARGDFVELKVEDTGVGIPQTELPRLFERFHRVSGTRSRTYEGSGIGLALVQELVKLHQGAIEVASVEGEGTCFTVSIPKGTNHLPQDRIGTPRTLTSTALDANVYLEEAQRWTNSEVESRWRSPSLGRKSKVESGDEVENKSSSRNPFSPCPFPFPQAKPFSFSSQKAQILLVDDNADMRDYVKRLLVTQQYEVEAVSDGLAALSAIRQAADGQQMPDLVLTDVMMPNLDGFGLLQALRSDSQTQEIPIILLSARAGEEARIEGLTAGADDYLIKPFSARELLARVEASLKLAQLRREAGAALRESEEKYRTLFESIDEGFCIIEMMFDNEEKPVDYRFEQVNPAFFKLTGLPEDAQGKTARELVPDLEEFWFEVYGKVALTGEAAHFENNSEPMNRWFDVRASRIGNAASRQVAIVFNNITDRKQAEEILRRAAELDAFRVALADALRPLADPVEVQATASRILGEYLGANRVVYFEVRGADYFVARDYVNGVAPLAGGYPIDSFGAQLLAAFRTGRTVSESNVAANPSFSQAQQAAYEAVQNGAHIGVPLIKNGEFVAGLAVHSSEPRAWTQDEVALAEEVAERTWAAVERARAEAEVAADLHDTQLLRELGTRLATEGDIQTLYQEILTAAIALTRADAGTVQIRDEATQELVVLANQGFKRNMTEHFYRVKANSNTPCGIALRKGERTFVDFDAPDEDPDLEMQMHVDAGYLSAQSTPLITRAGKPIGMVSTHWRERRRPSDRELRFLDLLARQAADAIEQQQTKAALRDSEKQFRNMADNAPFMVWVTDSTGYCTYLSKSWYDFTGQTEESGLGFGWLNRTHPDDLTQAERMFLDALDRQEAFRLEYRLQRKDGEYIWAIDAASPWFGGDGQFKGFVGSVIDISDRKQVEIQLEQTASKLTERNQELDRFVYTVSHDLKAPLRAIANLSQWISEDLEGQLEAENQRQLELLRTRVYRMEALIEGLLAYSRVGRTEVATETVDVGKLIYEILDSLMPPPGFTISVQPQMPTITTKRLLLSQVFSNLISNAIKHCDPRSASAGNRSDGRIEIGAIQKGQYYEFFVADNGVGIAPENHERVFGIFQTLKGRDMQESTGIGLSIVKKIIETEGGSIVLESNLGEGATFRFTWRSE